MNRIWQFYPTQLGLYIRLAEEIVPHLDRAGSCYSINRPAAQVARLILKSEGKEFLPETRGEAMEKARLWGLLTPDSRGGYALEGSLNPGRRGAPGNRTSE